MKKSDAIRRNGHSKKHMAQMAQMAKVLPKLPKVPEQIFRKKYNKGDR